ncbi:DUF2931 family protein [uncultured Cytophaga sp.]|uniref:DUF2931 family protein n=1 Tax=uncultured Cytophaga sp. TaxID=160238 RepID=UPI00263951BA|nr:DUF2931 family protein [uncultured Cytophaga sp.]
MISSLLQFIVSACSPSKRSVHTDFRPPLEYASGICAPKLYPIRVHTGDFYTADDWLPLPNGGFVDAGWGSNGMNMSRSSIIPTGFKVTYFAYMENKFYTANFALPSDTIRSLFKEGMIDYLTKKYDTYRAMIVGMAPGGVLVVWMQGFDKQVEIGRYLATETEMNWESFIPRTGLTREEYVFNLIDRRPVVKENFQKNGLMLGLWDTYRIKYSWRPKFEFPEGSISELIRLRMFNGEYEVLWGDRFVENSFEKRAITERCNLLWTDETGKEYGAEVTFDEAEIFEAFKLIYVKDKEQDAELIIKYNDTRTSLEFYLRSKSEEIELEKTKVSIFKRT